MPNNKRLPTEERFWRLVDQSAGPDGCWLWRGSLATRGYGQFREASLKYVRAHRFAYAFLVGPIPEGLTIDHLCRVRACVNPKHLEPVTNRINVLRGTGPTARAAAQQTCKHGHPFDQENTMLRKNGGRRCRTCHRIGCVVRTARYRAAKGLPDYKHQR